MGFCWPGTGRSGDLPPRPECATTWRERVLAALPGIRLTLVIGQWAMRWHLPAAGGVTEAVRSWRDAPDAVLALDPAQLDDALDHGIGRRPPGAPAPRDDGAAALSFQPG